MADENIQFTQKVKTLNYTAAEINQLLGSIKTTSQQLSTLQNIVNDLQSNVHPQDIKILQDAIAEIRKNYIMGSEVDTKIDQVIAAIESSENRWISMSNLSDDIQTAIRNAQNNVANGFFEGMPAGSTVMREIEKINAIGGEYDDSVLKAELKKIWAKFDGIGEDQTIMDAVKGYIGITITEEEENKGITAADKIVTVETVTEKVEIITESVVEKQMKEQIVTAEKKDIDNLFETASI